MRFTRSARAFSLHDIMLDTPQHMASSPWCSISTSSTFSTCPLGFTGLFGDAHLASKAARVAVGHRGAHRLEPMSKPCSRRYSVVCMTHAVEFVVAGKGVETLAQEDTRVSMPLLDLLVVGLGFSKPRSCSYFVAAALQEVAAKVGHVLAHLRRGEGRGVGAEVHGALVEVAEHHLLVEVVHAAGVVKPTLR